MTVQTQRRGGGGYLERPAPSGLADVIEIILDKGLVIDAYVRVSLVGIEILTIDARVVVASVDTYLRFAEAANRLDMSQSEQSLPEAIGLAKGGGSGQDASKEVIQGMVEGDEQRELSGSDEEAGQADEKKEPRSAPTRKMRLK